MSLSALFDHRTIDPPALPGAPLPYSDLCVMHGGLSTGEYTPEALSCFAAPYGAVTLAVPEGLPLRVWINGAGEAAATPFVVPNATVATGDDARAANLARAIAALTLKFGDRTGWDAESETPFAGDAIPAPPVRLFAHARDVLAAERLRLAPQFLSTFARVAAATTPLGPLILEGVIVRPRHIRESARLFLYDGAIAGANVPLGFDDLLRLPLSCAPTTPLDPRDCAAFQRAFWRFPVPGIAPPIPCASVILRSRTRGDRRRFVLTRAAIHPHFRAPPALPAVQRLA